MAPDRASLRRRLTPWVPAVTIAALAVATVLYPWSRERAVALKAVPTGPQRLCVGPRSIEERCHVSSEVEALLASESLEVLRVRATPTGAQGATVLTLRIPPSELVFEAKWRALSTASAYNDPAAELIAYHAERLVLGPRDGVVPPAVARCLDVSTHGWWLGAHLEPHQRIEVEPGTGCALGVLSYWLSGSTTLWDARRAGLFPTPDGGVWSEDPVLYDPERFAADPLYRRAIANVNVIAFLIGHGDAHTGQFVLYRGPLHLFLVDNSIAFGARRNEEMDGRQDLAELHVPSIPAGVAARVASVTRDDVGALARVAGFVRVDGRLRRAHVSETIGDPAERVRRDADRVQIGLGPDEIDAVWTRLKGLRRPIARGRDRAAYAE